MLTETVTSGSEETSSSRTRLDASASENWLTLQGHEIPNISVQALPGSYAARLASRELDAAERIYAALEKLLEPSSAVERPQIILHLLDASEAEAPDAQTVALQNTQNFVTPNTQNKQDNVHIPDADSANTDSVLTLVRVVRPEAPGAPLAPLFTRLLLARWVGEAVANLPLLVNGIGGYVAAQTRTGMTVAAADDVVRHMQGGESKTSSSPGTSPATSPLATVGTTAQAATAPHTVPAMPVNAPDNGGSPNSAANGSAKPMSMAAAAMAASQAGGAGQNPDVSKSPPPLTGAALEIGPAATSFIAWLLHTSKEPALRQFLAAYDSARKDAASLAVYHQPLAALQQDWLASLQKSMGLGVSLRALLHQLSPLLKPYRMQQSGVFFLMFLAAVYSQIMPQALSWITTQIQIFFHPEGSPAVHGQLTGPSSPAVHTLTRSGIIVPFTVMLLTLFVLNAFVTLGQAYLTNVISQGTLRGLQARLFTHLQRLSLSFYGGAQVGDIMARMTGDLNAVQMATSQVINTGFYQTLVITITLLNVIYTTLQASVFWPMGVLMIAIIPFFMIGFLALRKHAEQASRDAQKLAGITSSFLQENLSAQPVVKALGLEQRVQDDYGKTLDKQKEVSIRAAMLSTLSNTSVQMVMGIGQMVVLCIGGWLVMSNPLGGDMQNAHGMTLATLIKLSALLPVLLGPIVGLLGVGQAVQTASGALERVMEVFDEKITVQDKEDAKPLPPLTRGIRFDHVTFGYDAANPVLHDIDLTIPVGAEVAFVGPSGCGKSTMVNLLMRFYDPQQGRVLFDGVDLCDTTLASLRGQIGLVSQETFVFNTTLRENIRLARPEATDSEVEAAASAAQLNKGGWIDGLPDKLDTQMGERGGRMSGGQRQRLAIARALLRESRLLLLDEATSALDAETEADVLATLEQAFQDSDKRRTTISIAHHLKLAMRADLVVVFEAGRIVEQGSHAQLAAAGGTYQRMFEEYANIGKGSLREAEPTLAVEASRLKTVPLFAGLDAPTLGALAARLSLERFAAGDLIVRQGEPGDRMYVIESGQAEVLADAGHGPLRVNMLQSGDYFGEMALLDGEMRTATVRATQSTRCLLLSQKEFKALLEQQPALRTAIHAEVGARKSALRAATMLPTARTAVLS